MPADAVHGTFNRIDRRSQTSVTFITDAMFAHPYSDLQMHEMGIANSVLDAVRKEMECYPGTYPCKVGLRVGEMAAIDPEALRFCFEAITRETDFASLALEIAVCPRRHRCRTCGREFVVHDYLFRCPACASPHSECISGDELELAYLEVEEYATSPVGAQSSK